MEFKDISEAIADVARRYHYHKPPEFLIYVQEMLSRIVRFLKDLFEQLHLFNSGFSDTRMVGNLMQILLYSAGIICTLLIIYLVFMRMTKLTQMSKLARAGTLESERFLTSEGWLEEAKSLAQKEQFKAACRAAYLSFLRLLEERDVAPFAPTKTNYEYWYQLSKYRDLQSIFRKLADTVELVWFGNKSASREDFEHCIQLIEEARETIKITTPSGSAAPLSNKTRENNNNSTSNNSIASDSGSNDSRSKPERGSDKAS
ncbi:MAG: DUF4129 domain-containing protein [Candidatus Obscuribacterales bacterium]|nr:DUF4129 domain-containing protein [Candidatus Obscuribacterales bacterium]